MIVGLALLSRVSCRAVEITGRRLKGLLALPATRLRPGCSSARLVDGLRPDRRPENSCKALQVPVFRPRTPGGSDLIVNTPAGYRLAPPAAGDHGQPRRVCFAFRPGTPRAADHPAAAQRYRPV